MPLLTTQPLVREEGPFPIQGNIGSLFKNELFVADMYTKKDTCGEECVVVAPFSYGEQNLVNVPQRINRYEWLQPLK